MKKTLLSLSVAFVAVVTASLVFSKPIVATAEYITVTTIRSATTTTLRPQRVRIPTTTAAPSTTTPPDTAAPIVNSFTSGTASPIAAGGTASYTMVFNEDVTGVAANDFANAGTADFCSFAVSGTAKNYTLTVTECVGGTIIPRFVANGARDLAGNFGPASAALATTTITAAADTTAPTVTVFSSSDGPTVDAFEDVVYTITFSERVNGVGISDFSNSGTAKGCSFSGAGNGVTWTMTVSGCAGGTIIPRFAANGASDRSGNDGPTVAATATTTITAGVETVPPTVLSFASVSPSPTSQSVVYTIVFSEDVTGVAAGDFANVGTAVDCSFAVSGTGDRRSVTVSDCRRGTIIPRLTANSIEDLSGNVGPASAATATVTIFALPETTPPAVDSFTSAPGNRTVAAGTTVTYALVFSESVNGVTAVDFTNTGDAVECSFAVSGSGSTRTITVSGCIGGTIIPQFAANGAFDLANNEGPTTAATATTTITIGGTPPTTTTTAPSVYPPGSTTSTSSTTSTVASTTTVVRNSTTTTLRPQRIRIR